MANAQTISFFTPTLDVGGAERVVVNLANGLAERGHQVDLVVGSSEGELAPGSGVNQVELETPSLPGYQSAGFVLPIYRYLKRREPHSFYSAMNHVNIPAICAWLLSGTSTKLVISEHNTPSETAAYSFKNKLAYLLARPLYPRSDEIVAVSNGVADDLAEVAKVDREEIETIYNPVVTDELLEQARKPVDHPWFEPDTPPVVISLGNMRPQKDFATLLNAFAELRQRTEARLLLMGDGEKRDELKRQSHDLGIEEYVSLPGYVDNPYKFLNEADVFALSSRWEGFGNVIVEAMACGCPVVATDCPNGPSEILRDGEFGTLVPVGDCQALARGIAETLENSPDLQLVRNRAMDFSLAAALNDYEKILIE